MRPNTGVCSGRLIASSDRTLIFRTPWSVMINVTWATNTATWKPFLYAMRYSRLPTQCGRLALPLLYAIVMSSHAHSQQRGNGGENPLSQDFPSHTSHFFSGARERERGNDDNSGRSEMHPRRRASLVVVPSVFPTCRRSIKTHRRDLLRTFYCFSRVHGLIRHVGVDGPLSSN